MQFKEGPILKMSLSHRLSIPCRVQGTLAKAVLGAALMASLQGCPLLVIGAAGGGAMMASDRRTVGTQTEDREIQIKAQVQMNHDLPDSAHASATVINRRVLLTGEVPTDAAKRQAEAIVHGIDNVQGVINELAVQPEASFTDRSNDLYLEGRVKSALIAEKGISANDFKVVCARGNVYLMGLLTKEEGDQGALVASQVPGVMQVIKVYRYITPEQARALSLDTQLSDAAARQQNAAPAANGGPAPGGGGNAAASGSGNAAYAPATTSPVDVQSPAPIVDSAPRAVELK
jgi:osmotically-inducible protein OsmY